MRKNRERRLLRDLKECPADISPTLRRVLDGLKTRAESPENTNGRSWKWTPATIHEAQEAREETKQ